MRAAAFALLAAAAPTSALLDTLSPARRRSSAVHRCRFAYDDCVDGAFARLVKGSRRAAGPLGPLLLLLLLAVSVGLTLLWRDDLTEAYFGRAK